MRFWDTSALVPLLVREAATEGIGRLYRADAAIVVAWTAAIECVSACSRRHREGALPDATRAAVFTRLRELQASWHLVEPTEAVRTSAERVVARHGLRAGDAIQLASAMATETATDPALEFVCLDRRLAVAAVAEGLRVIDLTEEKTP